MSKAMQKGSEKGLISHVKKTGGRSREGRITAWQRGGGHRKLYRQVEFGQENLNVKGEIRGLEYDPNRNAYIALVAYENGKKGYVLAPQDVKPGDSIVVSQEAPIKPGNRMRIVNVPVGTMVHNVELEPEKGGKLARGAGNGIRVLAHEAGYTHIQLPSSEVRKISSQCFATIGMVSNPEHMYQRVKNAGRTRLMGRRPEVRGTAMNPVDHPHGGGEGRTGRGMKHPKTPWGKPALGVKTRRKKWSDKLLVQRRKKKKRA